ncbi:MAG: ParB/RepB/Spo0J family partition protein [Chloroflexi bacterium]|nr:ParB/RepB/Spo0J family partition protein [Chloroflexota bacterium]
MQGSADQGRGPHRPGLGRGLGALIPRAQQGLVELDPAVISPNPQQPRTSLDEASLAELAESVRQHGVLQPIVVSRADDGYVLIAGERRWRAARLAGLATVPAIVKETAPHQRLELALVENLQREDLSPLEAAAAYQQLIDEHGLTQEKIATRVGRSRAAVANALRLPQLPESARAALAAGRISEGHARALLGAPDERTLLTALAAVLAGDLTVRATEALVRRGVVAASAQSGEPAPKVPDPDLARLEERFRQALGTKVQLQPGRKGGKLVIHYFSDDELEGLERLICGE